jgi:predicted NAD-dependent protein-ADP-ribosyltransferase YbiA (DUF1768 family)
MCVAVSLLRSLSPLLSQVDDIQSQNTALNAKKCNSKWRKLSPIDVAAWSRDCEAVMLRALRAKFAIPELKAALLATGSAKLVEVPGRSKDRWAGDDGLLGALLMRVRAELAERESSLPIAKSHREHSED